MQTFIYLYCFVGAWMSGLMFEDYAEYGYVRSFLCGMGIIYFWPYFLILKVIRAATVENIELLEHPVITEHKNYIARLLAELENVKSELMAQENYQQEVKTLRAELDKCKRYMTLGVGDGNGTLFVHGDFESIHACRDKLFELESLRTELTKAQEENAELERCGLLRWPNHFAAREEGRSEYRALAEAAEAELSLQKRGWEARNDKKDKRIKELELALSGRTYCHSDAAVEARCKELEAANLTLRCRNKAQHVEIKATTAYSIGQDKELVTQQNRIKELTLAISKAHIKGMEEMRDIAYRVLPATVCTEELRAAYDTRIAELRTPAVCTCTPGQFPNALCEIHGR